MVYLHATLQLTPFKSAQFSKLMTTSVVPLFEKHGAKLIGSWETIVGNQNEVTDLWSFDSVAHFEASLQSLVRDPEWSSVKEAMTPLILKERTKLLTPLKCSPLK